MEVFWLGTAAMKAASVLLEPFGATKRISEASD